MAQSDNGGRASGSGGIADSLRSAASGNPIAERLLQGAGDYLGARSEKLASTLGEKVSGATRRLTDVGNGDAEPGSLVGRTAKNVAEGESPGKALLKGGLGGLKDKVKNLFGKGGGGNKKFMNIEESIDVGVPVRQAYNVWTQLQDVPKWSKAVQSVSQDDETKSGWNAKIFLSKRNWKAKITEQIPDRKIQWTSDGPKGTVDGVVTFHEIAPNLTRILLVLEYHPGGLFEKTGNLWRAQGRRTRLDLKLYRRYVMTSEEDVEGWRGEIRDGEVVRDHDEVTADERAEDQDRNGQDDEYDEDYDDTADEDEDEADDEDYDEADEDYDDEDYDDEEDEEEPPARRRRAS